MGKFILGLALIGIGYGFYAYCESKTQEIDNSEYNKAVQAHEENQRENALRVMINNSKSLEELSKIKNIPDKLSPYYNFKKARFLFEKAEALLYKASEVENAFSDAVKSSPPMPPANEEESFNSAPTPQTPPEKPLHPMTIKLLSESFAVYEEARKLADGFPEQTKDKELDFRNHYLKGLIYHRFLVLFANQENVREIFEQTVNAYKMALRDKSADIDTVINVELLINDAKNLNLAGMQSPRTKMLNIRKAGFGFRTGN